MGDRKYFAGIRDIKRIAPLRLEAILAEPKVSQKGSRLLFTYWVHGEPYEDKPLLADEDGQFWIGKRNSGSTLLFEEYGSKMSGLLGCPSPEVDYDDSNGAGLVLSRFVDCSRNPYDEELRALGQVAVVPRLLSAYSGNIKEKSGRLYGELDCDANHGNFLIDTNGVFYQIDFSRPLDEIIPLHDVKGMLNLWGLTADPENEAIEKQIAQLKEHDFFDLYMAFTKIASRRFPEVARKYQPMFAWNFENVGRLFHSLHLSGGYRPIRVVIN